MKLLTEATADGNPPTDTIPRAAPRLADAVRQRGLVKAKLADDAGAEADLKDAVARFKALDDEAAKARKSDDGLRKEYARAVQDQCDFYLMRGKLAEAAPPHLLLINLNKALAYDPEVMAQRQQLALAYYRAGVLGEKKNGKGKGLAFFRSGQDILKEAVEAAPAGSVTRTRAQFQLAHFTARTGDHAAAVKDIPDLLARTKNINVLANLRYDAATLYAVAAGVATGEVADKYKVEAFAHLDWMLGPPVELADPVRLETDPDFDVVRADPRFKAAVAKAVANQKARAAE